MAKITINGITLDPLAQAPALSATHLVARDASSSNYILIQTRAPLTAAERRTLEEAGAFVLEHVPESTYLLRYEPADLDAIRNLPFVEWANVYLQGFKIAPSLAPSAPAGARTLNLVEVAAEPQGTLNTTPKTVDIVFHQGVDPESIRDEIAAAARTNPQDVTVSRHKVRLVLQARYLNDVAAIDEVRHIEEVHPHKLHNDVARQILRMPDTAIGTTGPEGDGQVVAVADTGFDLGSTTDVHPAFNGRVAKLYALGRPGNANDPDGHGTHVAGSVLGDASSAPLGITVQGTAPRATLVLQSVLDARGGLEGLPDDLNDLFETPYESDGARVHTNSWGSRVGDGSYNQNSAELDEFVWNHRDCVICFSAGNEGTDRNNNGQVDGMSITPPGTAKNCITVGATENNRPTFTATYRAAWPGDFAAEPIASDRLADQPDGMVAFSSRGPTRDQRVKPDVVAPGTFILSARSRAASGDGWAPSADPLYFFLGGTSMATPLVAGCSAVVREFLMRDRAIATPSAALVKALLINGAMNITGQYIPSEAGLIPNNAEGFGRVDMTSTIGPFEAREEVRLQDEGTELDTGEEETVSLTATSGTTLKATLVWTDPSGASLQNDLDLIVRARDGQERHGNVSPSSTAFDRFNNVEQVTWADLPEGEVTIVVRAHRVTRFAQSYALVVRTS